MSTNNPNPGAHPTSPTSDHRASTTKTNINNLTGDLSTLLNAPIPATMVPPHPHTPKPAPEFS